MDPALVALAKEIAAKHSLDPALVCAICEHESSWDAWAVRYEPSFEKRYIPQGLEPTEHYSRAFSYGLMQIMGETARELGFLGKFLPQLCDPAIGIEYGCRKLDWCMKASKGDAHDALQKYNGGADPNYGASVLALKGKYE